MRKKKILFTLILVSFIVFIIPLITTISIHSYYFAPRTQYENNYYDYLSTNNPNFQREEIEFKSGSNTLRGFIYSQKENINPKAILIWVHGINVSHENYLSEINYLTKENYIVFSYDNTGVNYSDGNGLKGLLQSPLDLQNALDYLYDLSIYNNIPNILIGHSWGGFSVATVSQLPLKREVDGIISLGGFWKNIDVLVDTAEYYIGNIANIFTPYLTMYESSLFFKHRKLNGVDGLKNSNCNVLIIHSKDDVIVHFDSFTKYKSEFSNDNRFTFYEYENFGHQLTIEKDSYNRIHDIMHHEYTDELNNERNELINDLNYIVMSNITDFLNNIKKAKIKFILAFLY